MTTRRDMSHPLADEWCQLDEHDASRRKVVRTKLGPNMDYWCTQREAEQTNKWLSGAVVEPPSTDGTDRDRNLFVGICIKRGNRLRAKLAG